MQASVSVDRIFALVLLAAPASTPTLAAQGAEPEGCRASAPHEVHLSAVDPRGELDFGEDGHAVLSGLHWPEDESVSRDARTWLLDRKDRLMRLTPRGETDRWGRARVDAATIGEDAVDLARGLIAAGLAFADAGEADEFCHIELLSLEDAPRKAGIGVWARPIREARNGADLETAEGDFVVAQGRVLYVGERKHRTYLNFGRPNERSLSVTVPKRTWRIMLERGLTAAALKGRVVRVRGRLEVWRGPVIDIRNADMIELPEGQERVGDEALRR